MFAVTKIGKEGNPNGCKRKNRGDVYKRQALRRSEYTVSLLRHDMRHFLTNLSGLIEDNETEQALSFIGEIISTTDRTATRRYCKTESINLILSSYADRITGKGSVFYRREDADTPQAEAALYRVEDIAAKTLEYMTCLLYTSRCV